MKHGRRTQDITKNKHLKTILTLIAIAVVVVGFFTLIGRVENQSSEPAVAEQQNSAEEMDSAVSEAEKLNEAAPAAGAEQHVGEELPANNSEKVRGEIFGFQ